MSHSNLEPRRAAEFGWPGGDHPGALAFPHAIEPALSDALLAALAGEIELPRVPRIHALTLPAGAIGRFRLAGDGSDWFLRVSARWGEPALEQSITGFLRARGVPVNHLVRAGLNFDFAGERYRLDVRDLVDGRHFNGSLGELAALSTCLHECHRHLRDFPLATQVRALSEARFARLEGTRVALAQALAEGRWEFVSDDFAWAEAHGSWMAQLVDGFDPHLFRRPGAQCLHAQIHRANVLFAPGPILVDWEEAVQTFAPPAWDLAYFVQRFCAHDDAPLEVLRGRLETVRAAYPDWPPGIAEIMPQAAWFSLLIILANRRESGIVNPPSEYEKFVRLERQASALKTLVG